MKYYCQLCGCYFQSENAVDCPRCGSDRIVQGGGDIYD